MNETDKYGVNMKYTLQHHKYYYLFVSNIKNNI